MEAFLIILLRRSWWTRHYFRESENRNWRGISQWRKAPPEWNKNKDILFAEIKIRTFYLQRKTKSSHHCTELLMYGICSNVEIVEVLKFNVISKIRNTREDKSLKRQWYQIIYYYYFILLHRCEIVFDVFVKNICFEKIVFASNCTALRAKLFPFFRDITTITHTRPALTKLWWCSQDQDIKVNYVNW